MRKIAYVFFGLLFSLSLNAQILNPVKLRFSSTKADKNTYEIYLKADIQKGWHIFSQNMDEGGPLPTSIVFKKNDNIIIQGKTKEIGKLQEKYEDVFMVNTKYYYNNVDFVQLVKKKTDKPVKLEGTITYMACKNEQCLAPQDIEFEVILN